jgi:hypothetical protein
MTALVDGIKRYAVLQTDAQATAVALWSIHAHTMDTAEVAPRLMINSPVPECGKTVLLGVVGRLVPRPEISSNISPAALFRTIELIRPTVLVDEADTFVGENDELRGLLNSGHTRTSAYTRRMVKVGEDLEPRKFSTWAAICIAGIGKLHPSIMSRSLVVTMQRKMAAQKVARLLSRGGKDLNDLGRKIARWAADHRAPLATLADVEPELPEALGNRAADNWIELIGLADLIGGDWPRLARRAAVEISTNMEIDDQTFGVQLLTDMQTVFASAQVEGIWTEDLLRHLHAMPERPWSEYGRQRRPITDRGLATLLKDFGVRSKQVWKGEAPTGANKRGYLREDLESAFSRYVNASRSARVLDSKESAAHSVFRSARANEALADEKTLKATATAKSSTLAAGEAISAEKGEKDAGIARSEGAPGQGDDAPRGAVAGGWLEGPQRAVADDPVGREPMGFRLSPSDALADAQAGRAGDAGVACCHCAKPIRPEDRVIERDDGELIHAACFRSALSTRPPVRRAQP